MTTTISAEQELHDIAAQITEHAEAADALVLTAARLLANTKMRFDRGEFPGADWQTWSNSTLRLGASRLRELLQIGRAPCPEDELRRMREANAERQQRHRDRVKAERGPAGVTAPPGGQVESPAGIAPLRNGAEELIRWARTASAEHVSLALEYIRTLRDD